MESKGILAFVWRDRAGIQMYNAYGLYVGHMDGGSGLWHVSQSGLADPPQRRKSL